MSLSFNFQETMSAFMVLFAVIDITGLTPILMELQRKGGRISAEKPRVTHCLPCSRFYFWATCCYSFSEWISPRLPWPDR